MKNFVFFVLCMLAGSILGQIEVILSPASEGIPALLMQVTNNQDRPLSFSLLNSPFHDTFIGSSLDVVNKDGHPVNFLGPLARFSELRDEDILRIEAGQTVSKEISLNDFFELNEDNQYQISLSPSFNALFFEDDVTVESNTVTMKNLRLKSFPSKFQPAQTPTLTAVDPKAILTRALGVQTPTSRGVPELAFKSCTSAQKSDSNIGWDLANSQLAWGVNDLARNKGNSAAYKTWFGSTTAYFNQVQSIVNRTDNSRRKNFQTVDCNGQHCTSNTYAYVFPNDRNENIYLCGAYWRATNGDKGATMTHELSHFTVNGGTDDIVYGTANCQNLARSNPRSAAINADNYAFYLWKH